MTHWSIHSPISCLCAVVWCGIVIHIVSNNGDASHIVNRRKSNNENSELSRDDSWNESIPKCGDEDTICAMLQVNAKGVQVVQMCECSQQYTTCSRQWDSEDGHSITEGSDQYKFCGSIPVLSSCTEKPLSVAYRARSIFSEDGERLSQTDRLQCFCPRGYTYKLLESDIYSQDGQEYMEHSFTCHHLPLCTKNDVCRRISSTSKSFLITDKCQCPRGSSCPSLGAVHMTRMSFGQGEVQLVQCQEMRQHAL